jgi:hypothetical protein
MASVTITRRSCHKGLPGKSSAGNRIASCGAPLASYYVVPEKIIKSQLKHGFGRLCARCYGRRRSVRHRPRLLEGTGNLTSLIPVPTGFSDTQLVKS